MRQAEFVVIALLLTLLLAYRAAKADAEAYAAGDTELAVGLP